MPPHTLMPRRVAHLQIIEIILRANADVLKDAITSGSSAFFLIWSGIPSTHLM